MRLRWLPFFTLIIGIGIGAALFPAVALQATGSAGVVQQSALIGTETLTEAEQIFADVYNNLAPSVVSITVAARDRNSSLVEIATGSGFVINTSGHIVTNYHVVEGADRIEVQFFDGTITRAEIVGLDADSDIAVIQVSIPVERLRPVTFANSDNLLIGQAVLALGNPFDNNWTLTSGIISAMNRRIFGRNSFSVGGVIQTDAAINPGNSGGPLLNLRGEVVGMNTQIATETGTNSGIGFAIPSNLIVKVASALIEDGQIRYPYIGISYRPIDLDLIEAFNLPDNIRGVPVLEAPQGLPAALAGIRGISPTSVDIILSVEDVPMRDFDELVGWLAINTSPGMTVTFTVYRNGSTFDVPVTLIERPTR